MNITIDLATQTLTLCDQDVAQQRYSVSTSSRGAGEREGSFCTPRGRHRIHARIGAGAAPGTVFVGRRPTGEIYSPRLAAAHPGRDWILTRILWLCGEEPGRNRFGAVDTMRRFIYIHGAPATATMGRAGSRGCIRMHHDDIIELFDRVCVGTRVDIVEQSP
ncbi:MAG: L,D-transpeptidase [Salinisphaera sp.]|nr:L,D-transpeptidase [Salinisphaera sp.]